MNGGLAHDLTELLFRYGDELVAAHPESRDLHLARAQRGDRADSAAPRRAAVLRLGRCLDGVAPLPTLGTPLSEEADSRREENLLRGVRRVVALAGVVALAAGCGGEGSGSGSEGGGGRLSVATGGTAGVYFVYGGGWPR